MPFIQVASQADPTSKDPKDASWARFQIHLSPIQGRLQIEWAIRLRVIRWQHCPGQNNPLAQVLGLLSANSIQKQSGLLNCVGTVGYHYPKNIWVIQRSPDRKA
jgi:hypothetical protein